MGLWPRFLQRALLPRRLLLGGTDRAYYGLIKRGGHTPTIMTLWRIPEGLADSPSELIKGVELQIEIDLGKRKTKVQYKKLFYDVDAQLRSGQVEEPSRHWRKD